MEDIHKGIDWKKELAEAEKRLIANIKKRAKELREDEQRQKSLENKFRIEKAKKRFKDARKKKKSNQTEVSP